MSDEPLENILSPTGSQQAPRKLSVYARLTFRSFFLNFEKREWKKRNLQV